MEDNKNLELYNKYREVPQNALKDFDNGRFKGTDINTMWRIRSLTEAFGVCGVGWYYTIKRTWTEETPDNEIFAFAEIELFIKVDGEWSKPISGNGGNKLTRVKNDGDYSSSDEAFKMAVTDALGVACKMLGFGADVYWNNDKTKYAEASNEVPIEKKINDFRWKSGKHKGCDLYSTPIDYIEWYAEKGFDKSVQAICEAFLEQKREDDLLQSIDPDDDLPF